MKKWRIFTSLLLVLLVVQTPQFRQNTSIDPGKAHRRQLDIGLLRTINTAEATYHSENGLVCDMADTFFELSKSF